MDRGELCSDRGELCSELAAVCWEVFWAAHGVAVEDHGWFSLLCVCVVLAGLGTFRFDFLERPGQHGQFAQGSRWVYNASGFRWLPGYVSVAMGRYMGYVQLLIVLSEGEQRDQLSCLSCGSKRQSERHFGCGSFSSGNFSTICYRRW